MDARCVGFGQLDLIHRKEQDRKVSSFGPLDIVPSHDGTISSHSSEIFIQMAVFDRVPAPLGKRSICSGQQQPPSIVSSSVLWSSQQSIRVSIKKCGRFDIHTAVDV